VRSSFLFNADIQNCSTCNFIEEWYLRQDKRKERKNDDNRKQILFNLGPLDGICQIFTDQSVLVSLASTTGVGKSIFSVNIGANSFLEKINVAHFIFENTLEQITGRYDSRLLSYSYRNLMRYKWKKKKLKDANKRMEKFKKRLGNRLRLFHFPMRTCSVFKAESVLREIEISSGWKPGVIIYDSLDHMIPDEKQESHRLNVTRVYEEAKWQSEIRNVPIFNTTHLKAQERHQIGRTEGFSESYDKSRISDVWISINQTVEQEDDNQALIFLDKNRDDVGNVKILVDLLYSVMTYSYREVVE